MFKEKIFREILKKKGREFKEKRKLIFQIDFSG